MPAAVHSPLPRRPAGSLRQLAFVEPRRTAAHPGRQHRATARTGRLQQGSTGSGFPAPECRRPGLPAKELRASSAHSRAGTACANEAGPADFRQHPGSRTGHVPQPAKGRSHRSESSKHGAPERTAGNAAGTHPRRSRRRPGRRWPDSGGRPRAHCHQPDGQRQASRRQQ
ncbi:hypothetical protein D3C80_1271330 [compost metagenome]